MFNVRSFPKQLQKGFRRFLEVRLHNRGILFSQCHGAVNFDVFEPMP